MKADELKHAADTYNNSIINLKIDDILNTAKLKSEKGMYNMSINYYLDNLYSDNIDAIILQLEGKGFSVSKLVDPIDSYIEYKLYWS